MAEEYITVGKILNTHGRSGAVRVLPLTDFQERFNKNSRVQVSVRGARKALNIEESFPHQKYFIVKFAEIPDMNAAEEIKGGLLEITRQELYPLPEHTYYIFDIIGLTVSDKDRGELGKITDVLQTGSNDVYVVDTGAGQLLIPALKQVVKEIDLSGRIMVVELPAGLADDEN
jgi:16S rRNA processing protein RimM